VVAVIDGRRRAVKGDADGSVVDGDENLPGVRMEGWQRHGGTRHRNRDVGALWVWFNQVGVHGRQAQVTLTRRAQTLEVTLMSSVQSTARMSERLLSAR